MCLSFMNLSNLILSPFILCSISWQWIPLFFLYVYIYLVWKSASFCWFYTCDPFQLGACQFLCSEKEWVVYFGSLSPLHCWFYRLPWHLLSSTFYRVHDSNRSLHRRCSMPCCPQRPQESCGESHQSLWRPSRGWQQYAPSWSSLLHPTIHNSGFS